MRLSRADGVCMCVPWRVTDREILGPPPALMRAMLKTLT